MSDTATGPQPDEVPTGADEAVVPVAGPADDASDSNDASDTKDSSDTGSGLDLDLVERDLADVEQALARLDAGTYWTDEITGAVIPDEVLAEQPTARRSGGR